MNIINLFLIVILLFSSSSLTYSHPDANLQKTIQKFLPDMSIYESTQGMLNGAQYTAALLTDKNDMLLAIFKKQTNGSYHLIEKSPLWIAGGRSIWAIRFEKNSIFLLVDSSGGCCSRSGYAFQFKKTGHDFPLIGVEDTSYGIESINNSNDFIYYEQRASTNFMTYEVIHSRRSGKAKPTQGIGFASKTDYAERKFKFHSSKSWSIKNINPESYSDFVMNTRNLCGGINSKMQFERYSIVCKD